MKESPDFETLFAKFRKDVAAVSVEETFPRLTILGSSSATPTKFRNMSGYFVELSDDFCFFVDCGEGTYGQLLALFGPQRTAELLIKLKFIFLSHGHQDHVIGIFDLVLERRKAFLAAEKTFTPLRVLAPTIVFPTMNMYDMSIEKMTDYFEATLTTRPRTQEETAGDLWDKDGVIDVGSYIPGFESWPVKQLRVVTVHHPRQAKALILETTDGKKLVFSGDTKPCNRLIAAGKDADLLVHEATFCDEFTRDAEKKSHSTMSQAVEVGEKMNAKMTLLTHFSARYKKVPLMPTYLDAKANVGIVMDNMVVRWSELPLIPRLIPLFRAIYSNEIDDVKTQLSKRNFKKMNSLVPNADPEQSPKIAKKAQRLV
uniref:ribonuclease Z n=1 Tax=Plectus sambesii TaxID=2011161 RepID=A0A914UI79_9BILA